METRKDYLGLSTDEKPEAVNGSTFYEVDSKKEFINYKNTWYEQIKNTPEPPSPQGEENTIIDGTLLSSYTASSSYNFPLNKMIKKLPDEIETSHLKSGYYLFAFCENVEEIPEINTENFTNTINMFYSCTSIKTIPELNCKNVTTFSDMFNNCISLESVPSLNTIKGTHFSNMFYWCTHLTNIGNIDTTNALNISSMFNGCKLLENLQEIECSKVSNINNVLGNCTNLKNFGGFKNLGKAFTQKSQYYNNYTLNLSSCTQLSHDSLMNIINNLYDLNLTYASSGLYSQRLTLGEINRAKLTAEEIAIATNKGWSVG